MLFWLLVSLRLGIIYWLLGANKFTLSLHYSICCINDCWVQSRGIRFFFSWFLESSQVYNKKISCVVSRISPRFEYCSSGCCHQLGLREAECGIEEQAF